MKKTIINTLRNFLNRFTFSVVILGTLCISFAQAIPVYAEEIQSTYIASNLGIGSGSLTDGSSAGDLASAFSSNTGINLAVIIEPSTTPESSPHISPNTDIEAPIGSVFYFQNLTPDELVFIIILLVLLLLLVGYVYKKRNVLYLKETISEPK
jgi:hypothetical protein